MGDVEWSDANVYLMNGLGCRSILGVYPSSNSIGDPTQTRIYRASPDSVPG